MFQRASDAHHHPEIQGAKDVFRGKFLQRVARWSGRTRLVVAGRASPLIHFASRSSGRLLRGKNGGPKQKECREFGVKQHARKQWQRSHAGSLSASEFVRG